ncbi:type II secretion system minor pseudopilin GspK [Caulobacter sp. NIBR2454]|uniref:type II secretion system minor pseudopilin GspK n=1 Tax=Caulobacter sp. NIBR2454 TaxID=3015996 RepID=UPI0022B71E03|nr:type II secretion system minor pseudopilin GspK [Caulobacter sp. NIBR2454]
MRQRSEQGMALLMVLLLVAMMSIIAVSVLDDIRFAVRRSHNSQANGQAQWYALGAETLARERIETLQRKDPQRTTLAGGWNGRPVELPLDGGLMQTTVTDGSACFNLNSVVAADQGEPFSRRELGVRQFTALMEGLQIGQARQLAENLADWMDSNDVTYAGAEDGAYLNGERPYRTAGQPLAEVSELRTVQGFGPNVYARLRPWVCALPTTDLSPININTLPADKALLLSALTLGQADEDLARGVLATRPADGWRDPAGFWDRLLAGGGSVEAPIREQVRLDSRFFDMTARVRWDDAEVVLNSRFERQASGRLDLVARRWALDD